MSKFFLHGTDDIKTMIDIIRTNGIKSRRLQKNFRPGYFNTQDYISVCKKERDDLIFEHKISAFETFIKDEFCFIITDEINAIKTKFLNPREFSTEEKMLKYVKKHNKTRYSDMYDEWQVKDEIPLNKIVGIGLPFSYIEERINENLDNGFFMNLKTLISLVVALNLDIVDTSDSMFIDDYENNKSDINKNKKKIYEVINYK